MPPPLHRESQSAPGPLRVAFSGHRDLARGLGARAASRRESALRGALGELLTALVTIASERGRPGVLWRSGLAEGADLIAADVMLGGGPQVGLQPVSPFTLAESLAELPPDRRPTAKEFWMRSWHPLELGVEIRGADPTAVRASKRAGYVELGEHLIRDAHLVVVLLDAGRESGGPGGTGWVWRRAGEQSLPRLRLQWRDAPTEGYCWARSETAEPPSEANTSLEHLLRSAL